jgi:UDP-glucose 4-epimerase
MSKPVILVCGGAGYIGSHTCMELKENYTVVILDDMSYGHSESIQGFTLVKGDCRDTVLLDKVFTDFKIDAVIYFAGFISVGESVQKPFEYMDCNFIGPLRVLQAMQKHKCTKFIFSSTAALFGNPKTVPIRENDEYAPINPYGESKLMVEKLLKWADACVGIRSVALRYFNACGAHESGLIGEAHQPETHLIPIILQVALGQRKKISIFGTDYDTPDGTCVRDYIHVTDLATAHIKALEYLIHGGKSDVFNLGSGNGFSVKEVIQVCRKVTGHEIPEEISPKREGDPAILVATSEKAEKILGWKRKYDTLESIVDSAWKWHVSHPNGYHK